MTVREMLARMTSLELTEWMAYFRLEPFGEERADLRAGMIAAPLINMWRGKNSPAAEAKNWLMKFGADAEDVEEQDPEEMAEMLKAFARAMT